VLVLGVALLLVLGVSRLLSTGGSADPQQTAATVGGSPTATADASASASVPPGTAATTEPARKHKKQPLPQPDGPCDPADLVVAPLVREAHAGDPIKVVLRVTTHETLACTWQVSPEDLFVTIADADATIWSSQQCPAVLPDEQIVPRQEKAARTSFLWNGRAADASCSAATEGAVMGRYRVDAVARGAVEPQESTFVIGSPTRATVTRTPTPTSTPSSSGTAEPKKDRAHR